MNARKTINENARYIDVRTLCSRYSLGRNSAIGFAKSVGAEIKIGKRSLYDVVLLDCEMEKLRCFQNQK